MKYGENLATLEILPKVLQDRIMLKPKKKFYLFNKVTQTVNCLENAFAMKQIIRTF